MLESMEPLKEQIAPEIIEAIVANATASGLSINDYLARLLGLTNGHEEEDLALDEMQEESRPRNEAMFAVLERSAERMKDVPVTGSTEETLKMIREARAGAMWGYGEPIDTE